MPSPHISFAKIVSTPSESTWSQAYNAGALFAVISLSTESITEDVSVATIGKSFLTALETEFYSLEEKSLSSITTTVNNVIKTIPDEYTLHLILVNIKNDIMYIVMSGEGKIILKRNTVTHTLFEKTAESEELLTASGFLENNDLLILQTAEFSEAISKELMAEALSLNAPNDISETLTPHIHETQTAGAAAIILTYHGTPIEIVEPDEAEENVINDNFSYTNTQTLHQSKAITHKSLRKNPFAFLSRMTLFPLVFRMKKRQLIFLLSACILGSILISGIYITKNNEQKAQQQTQLQEVKKNAQKEIDEGQGLVSLNKNLARDHFLTAEKILVDAKDDFPKDSAEEKEILSLLAQVKRSLDEYSGKETLSASPVAAQDDSLLALIATSPDDISFSEDDTYFYSLSQTKVSQREKDAKTSKSIIINDGDWQQPVGLAAYNGNLYILDKEEGVLKYVPTKKTYSKSSYFSSNVTFDGSHTASLAVDGSIWVLFTDGSVKKYTKGAPDTFTLNGLPSPLTKPSRIFTDTATTNLYILDPGSSSIVVISKTGAFINQYTAAILKETTQFVVREKDKKIYVLAKGKTYLLTLP
jgi:hypothetical protein